MKILTIGNSFAENAVRYLPECIASTGYKNLTLGRANIGGCSLAKHWNLVEQCDMLPEVKPYNFRKNSDDPCPSTLKEALINDQWDYITLQQVSKNSLKLDTYFPYIDNLHRLISLLAPQAKIVLHQTWAYRYDAVFLRENNMTQNEMFVGLKEAYSKTAEKLKCRVIPSGEAFQKAYSARPYIQDINFDFTNPQPYHLPDQTGSLHVGYHWKTGNTPSGKAELCLDANHANEKGCYLAGAVWIEMFTGKQISGNSFCPENVSVEDLALLKKAAHETVLEYGGALNT